MRRVEEDTDALAALFSELPVAQVSAPSEFAQKYHWYLNTVRNNVERNWRPPTEDTRLAVTVNFVINKDGSVSGLAVAQSSGDGSLDRLALRAVQLATFPQLPPGFSGDKLDINFTLRPRRRS